VTILPGGGWQAVFYPNAEEGRDVVLVVLPVVCFVEKDLEFLPMVPNDFECLARKLVFASTMPGFVGLATPGTDVQDEWKEWKKAAETR